MGDSRRSFAAAGGEERSESSTLFRFLDSERDDDGGRGKAVGLNPLPLDEGRDALESGLAAEIMMSYMEVMPAIGGIWL